MLFVPWILVESWEPAPGGPGVPVIEFEMRAGPPVWVRKPKGAPPWWTPRLTHLAEGPGYYGTPGMRVVWLEWRLFRL